MSPLRPLAIVKIAKTLVLPLALALGCWSDEVTGMRFPALIGVTLTPHSVTMAVGQTQQLTLVPYDTAGALFEGATRITFTSSDTTKVKVDANGVVTARAVGSSTVRSIVQSTSDNLTYTDQAVVTVVATPVTPVSFNITPGTVAISITGALTGTVFNSASTAIAGVGAPFYVTSDPKIAVIANGRISGVNPGQVLVIGSITVFGQSFVDTATFTVTYPTLGTVQFRQATDPSGLVLNPGQYAFIPSPVMIVAGGSVRWQNRTFTTPETEMDVTFDNPAAVTGGNIPRSTSTAFQTRVFPTAGTYTYRSTTNGATGTVIVQ